MNRDELRKKLMTDDRSAFERVQKFMVFYWGNDLSEEQIREMLLRNYRMNPDVLPKVIVAAKALLQTNEHDEALLQTIAWDVNRALEEETPAGARRWLEEKIRFTEKTIGSGKPG